MDPNELVARIRAGDADAAISRFLSERPDDNLESLAVMSLHWGLLDVSEVILRRLLQDEPSHIGAHKQLAGILYKTRRFVEATPHLERVLRELPGDAAAQSYLCWAYLAAQRIDDLRAAVQKAKAAIPSGEHLNWQVGLPVSGHLKHKDETILSLHREEMSDNIRRDRRVRADQPGAVTWRPHRNTDGSWRLSGRSTGVKSDAAYFLIDDGHEIPAHGTDAGAARLWTADFVPEGRHRIILRLACGKVFHDGGAQWIDAEPQWGASAETGDASEIGSDGLCLTGVVAATGEVAEYRFEYGLQPDDLSQATPWAPVPGNLNASFINTPTWTLDRSWVYSGAIDWVPEPEPHISLHWPFGQDPNHISGIGFMELVYADWHNSCQHDGRQEINDWECSDLRGAEFRIRVRTRDFDAKQALHCVGVGNVSTYWMLSGQAASLADAEGEFTDLTFTLTADPALWTYAGSNSAEQADHDRYFYAPLHEGLARNKGNIVLVAPFGSREDVTTGDIDIASAQVRYRDNNVLHSDSGARLVRFPDTSPCDPANLTNGIYGDPEAGWHQGAAEAAIPTFVWELPHIQEVTTLIIHQDPIQPTAKCRVALSGRDGDTTRDIDLAPVGHSVTRLDTPVPTEKITLALLCGKPNDGMGVLAFEVFARHFVPPPSALPVVVCADAREIVTGSAVYYRAVCRTATETCHGAVREFTLPAGPAPILHEISPFSLSTDKAVFRVRANAMGEHATLHWRLDDGPWYDKDAGWENTQVHRHVTIISPSAGPHVLTVRLSTARGKSAAKSVQWHTAG